MFEPPVTTGPREKGAGLGMALVHAVVSGRVGRIHVASATGARRVSGVGDDRLVRGFVRMVLRSDGHEVEEAADGLERFAAAPERYDLVVLDVDMPRLRGLQCLARMRELRAELPALLIGGSVSFDEAQLGMDRRSRASRSTSES